ncbi:hypothetical protein HDV05_000402 [Chytridiales sp. JEL 0842]|nr:hypothetical protein HDV05_000402 [Chytridiales sp. JEL 0842]
MNTDTDSDTSSITPPTNPPRKNPNVLICGTPGTGKTTTAEIIARETGLTHIEVARMVKEKGFHEGRDEVFDSLIMDEDRLLDEMEPLMADGGKVVDFHGCELFPERWFDLVIVLRTSNEVLYPRLEKRGYSQIKITENIECEIMDVLYLEAMDSYSHDIVHELRSESVDDLEENVNRVVTWVENYRKDNGFEVEE